MKLTNKILKEIINEVLQEQQLNEVGAAPQHKKFLKNIDKAEQNLHHSSHLKKKIIEKNIEQKFKRALRLQFLLIFENLFCRFLTSKSWRDADMINPSIESYNSLF